MISSQALERYLSEFLSLDQFADYCPNGIQVEGKAEISKLATAVTASVATIERAIEVSADALLVHHGILWKGQVMPIVGGMRKRIADLLSHDITLFAYHLPLDAHPEVGNNFAAARALGGSDLQPFADVGVQGTIAARPVTQLVKELEELYGYPAHVALGGPDEVRSIALLSGGGHRQIYDAIKVGADCFVTGSFDEPQWHIAHEEGIHFIAMGHSPTERIGPRALGEHLGKKFGLDVEFLDVHNPF